MYENGDLGYAFIPVSGSTETFYRRALQSFDASSNPIWAAPAAVAAVDASLSATNLATPFYHGTNSALIGSRFPIIPSPTGSEVIFFDQTVGNLCPPSYASNNCNNSYHLGAVPQCGAGVGWRRSPTGAIDFSQPTGTFQTAAIDGTVNYGGTPVWALGTNIFYGYRGEGFAPIPFYCVPYSGLTCAQLREANQIMHSTRTARTARRCSPPSARRTRS